MYSRARRLVVLGLFALLAAAGCAATDEAPGTSSVAWRLDRLDTIGGLAPTVLGQPSITHTPGGPALLFDGVDDGLIVDRHPLHGAAQFTAEVIFRPDAGGPREQRFLHLQEQDSRDRILFETRLTGDDRWFLDTYIKSGGEGYALYARRFMHPVGRWYHAALVVDGKQMRHYVDGELELSRSIDFAPQQPGRTAIGMRINEIHWFKGAVREARFTPYVLSPEQFIGSDAFPGSGAPRPKG